MTPKANAESAHKDQSITFAGMAITQIGDQTQGRIIKTRQGMSQKEVMSMPHSPPLRAYEVS